MSERKTTAILVKLSEAEKQLIEEGAQAENLPAATWIRALAIKAAKVAKRNNMTKAILIAVALGLTACGGTERDVAPALAGHWMLAVQDARTADVVLDGQGGGTMTFAGWTRALSREDDPNTFTTQIDGPYWLDLRVVETETGISGSICTYEQVVTKRQTTEIGNGCLSFTGMPIVTPPLGT